MPSNNGKANAMFLHLEPGEYVCFIDRRTVDVKAMQSAEAPPLPEGVKITFLFIDCQPGQSIQEAVFVQKMDKMDEFMKSQHPWEEIN